jgi:exopolysaccharide biosynthesis protein
MITFRHMKRNIRKFGMLAIACATVASPSIFGTANAQATVAPASAAADVAVPAGFTLIPAGTYTPLTVGDPALTETRSFETLEPGVTLTHIVRGTTPASPSDINTTLEGPFIVNVVTIDPKKAKGHLQVVRGQYLTSRNTVGQLVTQADGLVGINASFFDINDNFGVTDGLDVDNGQLVGNPDGEDAGSGVHNGEVSGPIINSQTNKLVLNGSYTWSGMVKNLRTGQSLNLTEVDKKPFVPSACASMTDQTQCTVPGDLVHFDPVWGAETPTGNGVEVVFDKQGDVASVSTARGIALQPGQTSIQATGSYAAELLNLVNGGGHIKTSLQLFDNGTPVHLTRHTQATTASMVQLDNGVNDFPYPNGVDTPTTRNPLTSVATTRNGDIILFTVEGRATFSVGMSYPEESAALLDLGAWNAVNLDGGGSTQLFTGGQYVTTSSDGYVTSSSGGTVSNGAERADGDALVWVP